MINREYLHEEIKMFIERFERMKYNFEIDNSKLFIDIDNLENTKNNFISQLKSIRFLINDIECCIKKIEKNKENGIISEGINIIGSIITNGFSSTINSLGSFRYEEQYLLNLLQTVKEFSYYKEKILDELWAKIKEKEKEFPQFGINLSQNNIIKNKNYI